MKRRFAGIAKTIANHNAEQGFYYDDAFMIHNYRWRLSGADGDPQYDDLEKRLAEGPVLAVPPITLDGDCDGVTPALDGTSYAKKFSGKSTHRIIKGIGHNLPQETPEAFAKAVVEVDGH